MIENRTRGDKGKILLIAAVLMFLGAIADRPAKSQGPGTTVPCADNADIFCDDGTSLMSRAYAGNGSACDNFGEKGGDLK